MPWKSALKQVARHAIRKGTKYAVKAGGNYVANKFKARNNSRGGRGQQLLTYDNDFKTDYVYKRMPKRKRKAWLRFTKKVNAVADRKQGLKKHLFSDIYRRQPLVNNCLFGECMLYSPDAKGAELCQDMGDIFRDILGASFDDMYNVSLGGDVTKFIKFESAMMEVTWRNNGDSPVIIDLYKVVCRKDFGLTSEDPSNCVAGIYNLGFLKQGQIKDDENNAFVGTGSQVSTQVGTTPFQSSMFCSYFKILNKRKIVIAPQNLVSTILKDPKGRRIHATQCRAKIAMRGHTHGYFWQVYGVPGLSSSTPVYATPSDVIVTIQKKYSYYLPVSGKDQTAQENA